MRVLVVSDISLVGNASAQVATSVLNHMGISTGVLPVAVLSSQTGGVEDFSYYDMQEHFDEILLKWHALGVEFDAVYTGYCGSRSVIEKTASIVKYFKEKGARIFVDPVLGDFGRLYEGFTSDMPDAMKTLVALADVIFPNSTEWSLLEGDKQSSPLAPVTVVTGIRKDDRLANILLDKDGETPFFTADRPGEFHCAGDLFASITIGELINGADEKKSVEKATRFVEKCIDCSVKESLDRRLGLPFERFLKEL